MTIHEFDKVAQKYEEQLRQATEFIGQDSTFFTNVKARQVLKIAESLKGEHSNVLDVGCGIGLTDALLSSKLPRLAGVDVSRESVELAKLRNPTVNYQVYDGSVLPYETASFDLVFSINVLHHVAISDRSAFIKELARVTAPNGVVAIFEHNPINPLTQKAVRDCPFDEGVTLVNPNTLRSYFLEAGLEMPSLKYILFFPFKGGVFRAIEDQMGWLPLGAQYFSVALKREKF